VEVTGGAVEVTTSAPGKVFLAGEYGVLVGGPAVIAAVEARLGCRVRLGPGEGRIHVTNGVHAGSARLSDDPRMLPAEVRFAAVAASAAMRRLGLCRSDVTVETVSDLDAESAKRGLGGSAAVVAATVGAVYAAAERRCDASDLRERTSLAVEAHRLAQGGGSGADVVAATVGGLVLVDELDASRVPADIGDCTGETAIRFERLELPKPLTLAIVATGRPAASAPRARRFVARAGEAAAAGAAVRAWCEGMRAATMALAAACRAGDSEGAVAAIDRAGALLERLAPLASIRILTPELRTGVAIARRCGAVAKPSGAGGGDCAIALVAEPRREELRTSWARAGLEPISAGVAAAGVRVESRPHEEGQRGTG